MPEAKHVATTSNTQRRPPARRRTDEVSQKTTVPNGAQVIRNRFQPLATRRLSFRLLGRDRQWDLALRADCWVLGNKVPPFRRPHTPPGNLLMHFPPAHLMSGRPPTMLTVMGLPVKRKGWKRYCSRLPTLLVTQLNVETLVSALG